MNDDALHLWTCDRCAEEHSGNVGGFLAVTFPTRIAKFVLCETCATAICAELGD